MWLLASDLGQWLMPGCDSADGSGCEHMQTQLGTTVPAAAAVTERWVPESFHCPIFVPCHTGLAKAKVVA